MSCSHSVRLCVYISQGERGELVWALTDGHRHWPGVVMECHEKKDKELEVMVEWYGQKMSCHVSPQPEIDMSSEASWKVSYEPLTCFYSLCSCLMLLPMRARFDLPLPFQGQSGSPEAVFRLRATLQFQLLCHQCHLQRGHLPVPAGVCACVRASV